MEATKYYLPRRVAGKGAVRNQYITSRKLPLSCYKFDLFSSSWIFISAATFEDTQNVAAISPIHADADNSVDAAGSDGRHSTSVCLNPNPGRIELTNLTCVLIVCSNSLSPRDSQENPKAGKILAIILGTVVGGLALLFFLFGLWLWGRIKKNKRLEEEAARAQEEGRTSADTVVEGAHNELQEIRQQEHGKDNGI